jgi:hypothetical protein
MTGKKSLFLIPKICSLGSNFVTGERLFTSNSIWGVSREGSSDKRTRTFHDINARDTTGEGE